MGKSKKGRAHSKGNRKDLLGDKPRPKETGADEQPQAHYLLNELRSSDPARKESAVVVLAQLMSNADARGEGALAEGPLRKLVVRLLEGGVIALLIERMFDTASTVRLHATGSLRNMAAIGDGSISSKMVQDDVFTALLGMLDQVKDEATEKLAVEALETMTALFESCEEAVRAFTRRCPSSLDALFRSLHSAAQRSDDATDLLVSSAQALHTVTDQSYPIVEQICRHSEALPYLLSLLGPAGASLPPLARLHVAGAVAHVYQELRRANFTDPKGSPFPSCPQPEALITPVLQLVAQHMDWAEAAEALANTVSSLKALEAEVEANAEAQGEEEEDDDDEAGRGSKMDTEEEEEDGEGSASSSAPHMSKKEQRRLRKRKREAREAAEQEMERLKGEWIEALADKRLALEVLANLAASEEGPEEDDEEVAWGSDDDEERMEAMAREQGMGAAEEEASGRDQTLHHLLRTTGLLPKLVAMLQQLCGGLSNDLPVELVRGVLDLRQRAAIALGNIIADYPATQLAAEAASIWSEFRSLCRMGLEEEAAVQTPWYRRGEEPWMGVLTGVMCSFVRRAPHMAEPEDMTMLSTLLSSSLNHEVRVNAAGMLGLVGSHVKIPAAVEGMGRALAEALGKEAHVMVEAEVLNAVMDVFSDDDLHPVFVKLGLLAPIKRLLPQFRAKVKGEAGRHGKEAVAHAKEVALNTSRFIKYKEAAMRS